LTTANSNLLTAAEAPIQTRSAELRKELGIADMVFFQILVVIVPEFFGTAVKAGSSHVLLWIMAIVLFFVPQAFVVSFLNRLMPLEGGLYEWARIVFNDWIGFLVAWNLWLTCTVQVAQVALVTTTYVTYAAGPQAAWMASNQAVLLFSSVGLLTGILMVARAGLRLGKWVSNTGSVFTLLIVGLLVMIPFAHAARRAAPAYHPLPLVAPALTLFSLSVFAKMTFGALSGFDTVTIFAGESRSPARNIARATFIATPLIALLYIFGTSSILAFVSPEDIDIIGPIPQALRLGLGGLGMARVIAPIAILLLLTNYLCSYVTYFSANARLPMVAGWDHLLPEWFTRLHQEYKTPVNSILFMGAVSLAASVAVLFGAGNQEAFATLQIWTWTFYGLAYLVMFAIPLLARKKLGLRPNLWLRLAAGSGFLITLLFVVMSVFPIVNVRSNWAYTLKTIFVAAGANTLGFVIYRIGSRRHRNALRVRPQTC
jgi:amino acid transporter